jgi:hypothetical protein
MSKCLKVPALTRLLLLVTACSIRPIKSHALKVKRRHGVRQMPDEEATSVEEDHQKKGVKFDALTS